MLKIALRLPSKSSFKDANTLHAEHLLIKYKKNDQDAISRLGFVVSKKISKSAVERNRMRRLTRSCFEAEMKKIKPGYDMLIIIKKPFEEKNELKFNEVLAKLQNTL